MSNALAQAAAEALAAVVPVVVVIYLPFKNSSSRLIQDKNPKTQFDCNKQTLQNFIEIKRNKITY